MANKDDINFNSDHPVEKLSNDELGFSKSAFYLAKAIYTMSSPEKSSYVIGINAEWGFGKSSLVNFICEYIKYFENTKTTKFNYDEITENITKNEENCIKKNDEAIHKRNDQTLLVFGIIFIVESLCILFILFFPNIKWIELLLNLIHLIAIFILGFGIILFILSNTLIKMIIMKLLNDIKYKFNQFIKLLEKYVLPKNNLDTIIIIKFNPWHFKSSEDLIKGFFDTLTKELGSYNDTKELSRHLKFYAKVLGQNISFLTDFLENNKTINQLKEQIEDDLKNLQKTKKILIIVDDIDRMENNEIKTIFKTVKLLADFPKMIYIMCYDKDKVCQAYKDECKEDGEYLKKIVQFETTLPTFDDNTIKAFLKTKIKHELKDIPNKNFEIESLFDNAGLLNLVKNFRDAKKLINSLVLKKEMYIDERIEWNDLIGLLALECFDFKTHKVLWDIAQYKEDMAFTYLMNKLEKEDYSNPGYISSLKNDIEEITKNAKSKELLKYLFKKNSKNDAISKWENYDKYFNDTTNALTNSELMELTSSNIYDNEEFKKKLNELHDINPRKTSDFFKWIGNKELAKEFLNKNKNREQFIKHYLNFTDEELYNYRNIRNIRSTIINIFEIANDKNQLLKLIKEDWENENKSIYQFSNRFYNNTLLILWFHNGVVENNENIDSHILKEVKAIFIDKTKEVLNTNSENITLETFRFLADKDLALEINFPEFTEHLIEEERLLDYLIKTRLINFFNDNREENIIILNKLFRKEDLKEKAKEFFEKYCLNEDKNSIKYPIDKKMEPVMILYQLATDWKKFTDSIYNINTNNLPNITDEEIKYNLLIYIKLNNISIMGKYNYKDNEIIDELIDRINKQIDLIS